MSEAIDQGLGFVPAESFFVVYEYRFARTEKCYHFLREYKHPGQWKDWADEEAKHLGPNFKQHV